MNGGFLRYAKIAGWVILVAGGVAVLRQLTTKGDSRRRQSTHAGDGEANQDQATPTAVRQAETTRSEGDQDQQEFALIATRFEGLYTPLHLAVIGKGSEMRRFQILREWDGRIKRAGQPSLAAAWSDLLVRFVKTADPASQTNIDPSQVSELLKSWYRRLLQWGLTRDGGECVVISDETFRLYTVDGDHQIGQTALIELPCWTFHGQVVERGVAHVLRE